MQSSFSKVLFAAAILAFGSSVTYAVTNPVIVSPLAHSKSGNVVSPVIVPPLPPTNPPGGNIA